MNTDALVKDSNQNTADFSAKIRPIRSRREIWSQPQSDVWLHLKGTVLIHESYLHGEIIKRCVPVERVQVIHNADVRKQVKDAWILLSMGLILFAFFILHSLVWKPTEYSRYLILIVFLFLLLQSIYSLLRLKCVIGLRIEYDDACFYSKLPYQPNKNKRLDELLLRLSHLQKERKEPFPCQQTVIRHRVPLLKQLYLDPMLIGVIIACIITFAFISLKSFTDGIRAVVFFVILLSAILIFRFLDSFVAEIKFPRALRKARRLEVKRKYEEMVPILLVFLKQNSSSFDGWWYLIQSQTRLGRYDEANLSIETMRSIPNLDDQKIRRLQEQIESWKIITERMGSTDPEKILPAQKAMQPVQAK